MRPMTHAFAIHSVATGPVLRTMSVSTAPGASAFTRMPRGTKSAAMDLV